MDHTYQSTMLMPASYAVLSEEEMTYLDGGADYSFNVGDYTVTLHPEVLVTYAMNVVVNGVYMLSQGSFQYFINTFKEGLSDGLSLTGVVKHNWNRMNTWSRVATVGMAGLAGYYAYAQVRSMYLSLKALCLALPRIPTHRILPWPQVWPPECFGFLPERSVRS